VTAAVALWARVAGGTALAVTLLLALSPPSPPGRISWYAAMGLGTCAGLLLFSVITRRRPRLPATSGRTPVVLGKLAFFGLWATNEEVIWRRIALGELLRAGAVPALIVSAVGFALFHRVRPAVHLVTGGAFGAVYLSTGVLAASVAAHWAYNVLVDAFVGRAPEDGDTVT
jgi:membrane protease YdiL (CAAX protease family)